MSRILAGISAAGILAFATAAEAGCNVIGFQFVPRSNDVVNTSGTVRRGTTCVHTVQAGPFLKFSSASIISPPRNGTLRAVESRSFRYQPRTGFTGTDQYTVRMCGRGPRACSTITYSMTVI